MSVMHSGPRLILAALTFWSGCLFVGEAVAQRIIVIGDSWAEPIGRQLSNVLVENGNADVTVSTTPFWSGPRNLDTTEGRIEISGWLNQWPNADYIYIQMGQNNWLCCWTTEMIGTQAEADLFSSIIDHMDNVVEYILSIRPDITMWWTAGEYFRPHHLGTPAQVNASHDLLADMAADLAASHPELNFFRWNGLFQVHYGFDGIAHSIYDPPQAIPPGDPSLPDPTLPSPFQAYPVQRPAHPNPGAYRVMAQALYDEYIRVALGGGSFSMTAGLNGNWWGGFERAGEGAQIEVADGGDGSLVFVATVYSYDTAGNQMFLVSVGTVEGETAEVDVFITEGGVWGDGFDPALVTETQWGTGTFTASSCDAMHMALAPNADYQTLGYTALEYDLIRLTTPAVPCQPVVTN